MTTRHSESVRFRAPLQQKVAAVVGLTFLNWLYMARAEGFESVAAIQFESAQLSRSSSTFHRHFL